MKSIHETSIEIIKILIESELSINEQLKVIRNVKEKLDFCKSVGIEMKQLKLNL